MQLSRKPKDDGERLPQCKRQILIATLVGVVAILALYEIAQHLGVVVR